MNLRHLIIPIDFSEDSLRALDAAATLARLAKAKLTLLHVVEPLVVTFGEYLPAALPTDEQRVAHAETEIAKAKAKLDDGLEIDTLVSAGPAWDVICSTAAHRHADLIVISSHGYTGLRRMLMGSTAERVVRHSSIPVLVIKPAAAA